MAQPSRTRPRSTVATVDSAPSRAGARPAPPRRALPVTPVLLGVGIIALVYVAFAVVRWTGVLPFGTDNDEYPIVARALLSTGTPVVGGVEATKYPLGYPLLLALFEALRLPALTAVVVNFALVAATVVVVVKTLEATNHGGFAKLSAAAFVVVNVALWGSTTSLMPDALITFLSALLLLAVVRMRNVTGVAVVSAISFAATSVKSVGVLLGGAASFALLFGDKALRRWFLLPGAAGVVALVLHALIVRPYPEATTGYGRVFFLVNPYDAAQGRASTGEIVARLWTRWDIVLGDWGKAVITPEMPRDPAIALTLILLAAGIWGLGRRWAYGVGLVAIYGAGLALWPFSSPRFGLPMLPLAAIGVAQLAHIAAARPQRNVRLAAVAVVVAAVAVHGVTGHRYVAVAAASERATYTQLHAQTAEAVHWAGHNIPDEDVIASPAYRELTERMGGRRILPVGYSRDPETLWAQTGGAGAEWFISITRQYPRRAKLANVLVREYPDRFEKVFENMEVAIWRITAGG